jgi:hypothetical protein
MNLKTFTFGLLYTLSFYANAQADLITSYSFSGNSQDESTNQYNGKNLGVTPTKDRFDKPNSAYYFNGNSYIDLGSQVFSRSVIDFTYALWFKTNYSGHINTLLSKRHSDDDSWYTLTIENNKPQLMLDGAGWFSLINSSEPVNDNKWHFIVATKEDESYKLYVDGVLKAEKVDSRSVSAFDSPMHIGHHGAWNNYFKGSIDDVKIYSRALSFSEIQNLHGNYLPETQIIHDVVTVEKTSTKKVEMESVIETNTTYVSNSTSQRIAIEKPKQTLPSGTPIYEYYKKSSYGGIPCLEFYNPRILSKTTNTYLKLEDVDSFLALIKDKRKFNKVAYSYGEINGTTLELDKEYLKSDFKGVPFFLRYNAFIHIEKEGINSGHQVEILVLFPSDQENNFQFQNSFDAKFFYHTFPNASQELVDEKIVKALNNTNLKPYKATYIDMLKSYPNSNQRENLIRHIFTPIKSNIDIARIKELNLTDNQYIESQFINYIKNNSTRYEYDELEQYVKTYGKNAKFINDALSIVSQSIFNRTKTKATSSEDNLNEKADLEKIINLFSENPQITDVKKMRISLCTSIEELQKLGFHKQLYGECEEQMIKIVTGTPSQYIFAKSEYSNSQLLRQLETNNNDIKNQVSQLERKKENDKLNVLRNSIAKKDYQLVKKLINEGYSIKELSFSDYYFIAENSGSANDAQILFSKLYSWSDDEKLLKKFPLYTVKIEEKRFKELQDRATNRNWCYECCEIYLNRYTNNPVKRKQVEEWRKLSHDYEIAEANRKAEEERERSRQESITSAKNNSMDKNRANKSELINECYYEITNHLKFNDSDSDGSLKVYEPSWEVEYNLSKKGIRLTCSNFTIEYGNKSIIGAGGDNWYFYGCNRSSIKVESQSAAIRKGCEVAYDTGNLTSK